MVKTLKVGKGHNLHSFMLLGLQIRVIRENFYHRVHKGGTEFSEIFLCFLCPTGRLRTAFPALFVVKSFDCGLRP